MTGLVEPLTWDTDFFGIPIGRANLEGATTETLRAIEVEARALGIACLYGRLDPVDAATAYLVQTFGHRLVEVAVTLRRPAVPFSPKAAASTVRRGTVADLIGLEELITTLAPWSRFAADPHFGPEAAERMLYAWVERAARDDKERLLLISEENDGVTGLSTAVRATVPRIDLIGVTRQGSGAAWALVSEMIRWADGGPIAGGPIAARNIASVRFSEHCGFTMVRTQYVFHRWLDEDAGSVPRP